MAAHVHHFTYGAFNPIAAAMLAFLGSFLGLLCAGRARTAHSLGRRNRWLVIAAFAIGGGGVWLMHFSAMLGFDVPDSPVRYDLPLTLLSLVFSVVTVGVGLMVVGHGPQGWAKTIAAGLLTGGGVVAMHYTGMEGMRISAVVHYDLPLVIASGLIAVIACTVSLRFAVTVRGLARTGGAAAVMAVAVCGMHYTAMAALSIELDPAIVPSSAGIRPLTMLVPITVITAATIVGVALSALQAMTEEEFTDGAGTPRRGVHAEVPQPWTLRQSSIGSLRMSPAARAVAGRANSGTRPSPTPTPAPVPAPVPTPAPASAARPAPRPDAGTATVPPASSAFVVGDFVPQAPESTPEVTPEPVPPATPAS